MKSRGDELRRDVGEPTPLGGKRAGKVGVALALPAGWHWRLASASAAHWRDASATHNASATHRRIRVWQDVLRVIRIALVERRLADDHRPLRPAAANRPQRGERLLLGVVHRLDDDDQAVRLLGEEFHVRLRLVVGIAQPAGVEELEDAALLVGKGIDGGGLRAGAKAFADLRVVAASRCADDRGLSLAGLAQQPEDGRGEAIAALVQDRLDFAAIDLRRDLPVDGLPGDFAPCP